MKASMIEATRQQMMALRNEEHQANIDRSSAWVRYEETGRKEDLHAAREADRKFRKILESLLT